MSLEIPKETSDTEVIPGVSVVEQGVGRHALGVWMSGPLLPEHG